MLCPSCGTANAAAARFCSECGTALGVPCPDCSFLNRPDAKNCSGCGKRFAATERSQAERRQLTVFFVDLVGSTALSETLDPEELRDLYAKYQAVCAEVIRGYDGHIAQYLGDGILAYFGYPIAHEDDALRAVRSGLEILTKLEAAPMGAQRPTVRIGVHTGLVVIGDVGTGQRAEQLALGEAPNVAARVQGEAEPDTMLISEATRRLVSGHFRLEDLGARALKGLSRPMQLWRVLGLSDAASRFDALTSEGLAPFVGREHEVSEIRTAWVNAMGGAGQAILLRGEAGIGKSRLLGAARSFAQESPHERFEAECSPYALNSPLHPVVRMIERRLDFSDHLEPAEKLDRIEQFVLARGGRLDEAVPLLASLLGVDAGDRYPASDLTPARQRQRLLTVLAQLQLRAPGGTPTLLVIEDLHWADPTTLELVATLVSQQGDAPLLVIGSTRPELPELWSPAPNRHEIRVLALPQTDVRSLVAGVVGSKSLPDVVLNQIIERTGGIPLFVEAVTRTVLESGHLREMEDRYELVSPLPPGLIPSTVHDSLMARIDRLGQDKVIAQIAATIGREFRADLLLAVSKTTATALDIALKRMMELDLISRNGVAPRWNYVFKHALIQDAAYESLLKKTRQEYHGRIADTLPTQFEDLVRDHPELLARHLEGAGRTEEAITGWMRAAAPAGARWALQECVGYYRRALSLLESLPSDSPDRIRDEMACQLAIAPPLMALRGWASREVERACVRARELCEQTRNYEGLFNALWGLWTVRLVRGEHEKALEVAKRVLEMAQASEVPILNVAARHATGFSYYYLGEYALARQQGEEAIALFDLEQERTLVGLFQMSSTAVILSYLAMSLRLSGFVEQGAKRQQELVTLIDDLNIPGSTAVGLGVAMYHLVDEGDVETVARNAERGYQVSVDLGYAFWAASMRIYRGWAQALRGEPQAGVQEMRLGLADFLGTDAGIFVPQWRLMLAQGLRRDGQPLAALAELQHALAQITQWRETYYEPEVLRERGEIQRELGSLADAESSLRRAMAVAHAQHARLLELRAALPLAELMREQGRGREGASMLRPLYDAFTEGTEAAELTRARTLLAELE
ncbi:MAG: AAA family ATPase [Gemmatimonadetes bacterium]|nr:AAA family ATPase [Gemmatimonadota bacterium]